jgi:hypothetical protein
VNQTRQQVYERLPDNSALVVFWANSHGVGPLLLHRDIVVVDAHADDGQAAPVLIRELLARKRRVFLFNYGFPADMLDRVVAHLRVEPTLDEAPEQLVELSLGREENQGARNGTQ